MDFGFKIKSLVASREQATAPAVTEMTTAVAPTASAHEARPWRPGCNTQISWSWLVGITTATASCLPSKSHARAAVGWSPVLKWSCSCKEALKGSFSAFQPLQIERGSNGGWEHSSRYAPRHPKWSAKAGEPRPRYRHFEWRLGVPGAANSRVC